MAVWVPCGSCVTLPTLLFVSYSWFIFGFAFVVIDQKLLLLIDLLFNSRKETQPRSQPSVTECDVTHRVDCEDLHCCAQPQASTRSLFSLVSASKPGNEVV